MFSNYLIVALRHLRRGKAFTFINIVGLALGLASCLLILLYVQDEASYDRFHPEADRIFRLAQQASALTPAALAPTLAETSSQVAAYTRVMPFVGDVLITDNEDNRYYESAFYWVDSTFFEVFGYDLLRGDPQEVFSGAARTLVITEAIAEKYFGEEDPLEKTLIFDVGAQIPFRVTGVMENPPPNTHFRPDFLAAGYFFQQTDWHQPNFHSYVLLDRPDSKEALEASLPRVVEAHTGTAEAGYQLQPVTDIHLRSTLQNELEPPGSLGYLYGFSAIALLILLIAIINFMNLATARSAHRAKEIGLRKTLGAARSSLIVQFLGESVLLTMLAVSLALPLVYLLLPAFNDLAAKDLALDTLNGSVLVLVCVGLTILVGVASGSYPAFFLSRFLPLDTLRGSYQSSASGLRVRKALVVSQFVIGMGLMIATFVIQDQLQYIRSKNLGFQKEQVVVVSGRMYGHMTSVPFEAIAQAFSNHPGVLRAAATAEYPGMSPRRTPFLLDGMARQDDMARTTWDVYSVDYDVFETLGLEVIDGRGFSRDVPSDETEAYIINEAALRAASEVVGRAWTSPIGLKLDRYLREDLGWTLDRPGRVIGVVRDFHYQSLHQRIAPLVLQIDRSRNDHFLIRLQTTDLPATLARLEATWQQFISQRPFDYQFLDASFDRLYQKEQRVGALFRVFTGLSLIIACLGLFGLAAFTAEQRTKEIGIRKVLGASVGSVMLLLSKNVVGLVLIAFVVSLAPAYLVLEGWLQGFAYRVDISWWLFLLAGLAALGIALLTVSYQSLRTALADPVDALRYE